MKKNLGIFLVVILFLILIPFYMFFLPDILFRDSDNVKDFFKNNYVHFEGGKQAELFFEKYVDLNEYNNIAFHYRNKEHKITLYKTYTTFCVDVEYTAERYNQLFEKIYLDTNKPDIDEKAYYYGNYLIATIMLDEPIYKNNYCGVFFNSAINTIRYMFLYKAKRYLDPRRVISRSSDLDWYGPIS